MLIIKNQRTLEFVQRCVFRDPCWKRK